MILSNISLNLLFNVAICLSLKEYKVSFVLSNLFNLFK